MTIDEAVAGGQLDPVNMPTIPWPAGELWRVYHLDHLADGFNATGKGNARFSPIEADAVVVPTLYAATTVQAAFMETVLHDVPSPSRGFILTLDERHEKRRVAELRTTVTLNLADLSAIGLRNTGLTRSEVIDSDKSHYPMTRSLGAWIYAKCQNVHGIAWTSRQDDSARAVVLFGSRLPVGALKMILADQHFTGGAHYDALLSLLDRLGASIHLTR